MRMAGVTPSPYRRFDSASNALHLPSVQIEAQRQSTTRQRVEHLRVDDRSLVVVLHGYGAEQVRREAARDLLPQRGVLGERREQVRDRVTKLRAGWHLDTVGPHSGGVELLTSATRDHLSLPRAERWRHPELLGEEIRIESISANPQRDAQAGNVTVTEFRVVVEPDHPSRSLPWSVIRCEALRGTLHLLLDRGDTWVLRKALVKRHRGNRTNHTP